MYPSISLPMATYFQRQYSAAKNPLSLKDPYLVGKSESYIFHVSKYTPTPNSFLKLVKKLNTYASTFRNDLKASDSTPIFFFIHNGKDDAHTIYTEPHSSFVMDTDDRDLSRFVVDDLNIHLHEAGSLLQSSSWNNLEPVAVRTAMHIFLFFRRHKIDVHLVALFYSVHLPENLPFKKKKI